MKKILVTFICFIMFTMPALAKHGTKFIVITCDDFNPETTISEYMTFTSTSFVNYNNKLEIPMNSTIVGKYESWRKERRFHKSGFFKCKLISYTDDDEVINVEDKNIQLIGRKYEAIQTKDAVKTGSELTATTVAAFVIPGIDIVYYFTKGAIQNKKADTRFKSGVHNAYDNSIFWFILKGKPIVLKKGDFVKIMMFSEEDIAKARKEKKKNNEASQPEMDEFDRLLRE